MGSYFGVPYIYIEIKYIGLAKSHEIASEGSVKITVIPF
jgi:hypothetical protein